MKRIDLGARGLAYFGDMLTLDTTFCRALRERIEAVPAEVYTLLPDETPEEAAYKFVTGGVVVANLDPSRRVGIADGSLQPVVSLDQARAELIRAEMADAPHTLCLVDDANQRRGDPCIEDDRSALFVGDEVFRRLGAEASVQLIQDVVGGSDYVWHGLAAVCSPPRAYTDAELQAPAGLRACLDSVRMIVATAYDREGFVVWRRTRA